MNLSNIFLNHVYPKKGKISVVCVRKAVEFANAEFVLALKQIDYGSQNALEAFFFTEEADGKIPNKNFQAVLDFWDVFREFYEQGAEQYNDIFLVRVIEIFLEENANEN